MCPIEEEFREQGHYLWMTHFGIRWYRNADPSFVRRPSIRHQQPVLSIRPPGRFSPPHRPLSLTLCDP